MGGSSATDDRPIGFAAESEDVAHFAVSFVEDSAYRSNGAIVEHEQYPVIGRTRTRVP